MARPFLSVGSPAPPTVRSPCTKSVRSPAPGIAHGSQRIWSGWTAASLLATVKSEIRAALSPAVPSSASNGTCCTDGRVRYSHERWLWSRGAVNAVPLSCSA